MAKYCINHPTKIARAKCRLCGAPICNECKVIKPHGVFCSEKCAEKFLNINKTISQNDAAFKKKKSFLPKIVFLIIILVIIYFIYNYFFK